MGYVFAIGALVFFVIAAPFIQLFLLPLFKFQTKVNTNQQLIEKTYNADNVIYNYEWFKQQKEDIDAVASKINNASIAAENFRTSAGPRTDWTFEDKTEDARLQSVVTGLKQQREDLVANYNARAKMANRNIFQDNLPLFIGLE
jgi:hypothetical protein